MATPHDKFFKAVFSRPENAASELRLLLPEALVEQLDFSTLKLQAGTIVDEELLERHTDLLLRVDFAGQESFLFLLFEHQSTVDPLMSLRLLLYMARIWERWLEEGENRGKTKIPAILPLVLYQGPHEWTAATQFLDLVDLPADLLALVRERLPSFRYVLDNLTHHSDGALRARGSSPLGTLALLLLRHSRAEREAFLAKLREMADLIGALGERGDKVLVFSYILELAEVAPNDITEALSRSLGQEAREAVMTAAEQLRTEGLRRAVLKVLGIQFGALAQQVRDRVQAGTGAELDLWLERALQVQSLDEVFAE